MTRNQERAVTEEDRKLQAALAPFFAAAMAEEVPPSVGLLNRIIADAAEVQVARGGAAGPRPAGRGGLGPALRRAFEPFGGRWGVAALAAVAAAGFFAGLSGDVADDYIWPEAAAQEAAVEGVEAYLELASVEG